MVQDAKPKDKRVARELLLKGMPVGEVAEATGITIGIVSRINDWLRSKPGKDWIANSHPDTAPDIIQPTPRPERDDDAEPEAPAAIIQNEPTPPPSPEDEFLKQQLMNARAQAVIQPQLPPPVLTFEQIRKNPPTAGTLAMMQRIPAQSMSESAGTLEIQSQPAAGKGRGNVNLTPWTLVWFDTARALWQQKYNEPYPEDLPAFIEDCVFGYMKSRGQEYLYKGPEEFQR